MADKFSHEPVYYDQFSNELFYEIPLRHNSRIVISSSSTGGLTPGEIDQLIDDALLLYAKTAYVEAQVAGLLRLDAKATPEDIVAGAANKWVDAFLLKEAIMLDHYEIPPATATVLGGIKVGAGLSVLPDGTVSVDAADPISGLMVLFADIDTKAPAPASGLVGTVYRFTGAGTVLNDSWENIKALSVVPGDLAVVAGTTAADRWTLLPGSGRPSGGPLPTATTTTLGGIKASSSITVAADGTATVPLGSTSVTGIFRLLNGGGLELSGGGSLQLAAGAMRIMGTLAGTANAPSATTIGYVYRFTSAGTLTSTWDNIAGRSVKANDLVVLDGSTTADKWTLLPTGGAVVLAGRTTQTSTAPSSEPVGSLFLVDDTGPFGVSWENLKGLNGVQGDLVLRYGSTAGDRWVHIPGIQNLGIQSWQLRQELTDKGIYLDPFVSPGPQSEVVIGRQLAEALQYVEDKFKTSHGPVGAEEIAQPGWVYTLMTVSGTNGATETTYRWRPATAAAGISLELYAKLTDTRQVITADTLRADLIRFIEENTTNEIGALACRLDPDTRELRLMYASGEKPDGTVIMLREDGINLLRVVQSWFTAAGLQQPQLPSSTARQMLTVLTNELAGENKMAPPVDTDAALQTALGPDGPELTPAMLAQLRPLAEAVRESQAQGAGLSDPATFDAAALELERILKNSGALPDDPLARMSDLAARIADGQRVELRLKAAGTEPIAVPTQQWTRLALSTPVHSVGAWTCAGGVITIPETGQYEVFVQVLSTLAVDAAPTTLLVRVCGPLGVYSGDSGSTNALGATIEHSAVIAAGAGDLVCVEVFAEGAGLLLHPGTATIRIARVDSIGMGTTLASDTWLNPPAPWGEGLPDAAGLAPSDPRSIVIDLPVQALSSSPTRSSAVVTGLGGAVATVGASGGAAGVPINLGSQVGRLFLVSGRVNGATEATLQVTSNGPINGTIIGPNPAAKIANNPELAGWSSGIGASVSATRASFDAVIGGGYYNPRAIYVSLKTAQLAVNIKGGNSSGGKVVLTDITPGGGEYIGCDITADGSFISGAADAFWGMDLAKIAGAINLWTPDLPVMAPFSKADGVGHRFCTNMLPSGVYRITAEYTVTGEHANACWAPGWTSSGNVLNSPFPMFRVKNADGSITYHIDCLYRAGQDTTGNNGYWFTVWPTATSVANKVEVSVKGWFKMRRLPEGQTIIKTSVPFIKGQPLNITSDTYPGIDTQAFIDNRMALLAAGEDPGLICQFNSNAASGFQPFSTNKDATPDVSWSGYGSVNPQGPTLTGIHAFTMQIPAANVGVVASASYTTSDVLASGWLRQRRTGTNGENATLLLLNTDDKGNSIYRQGLSLQGTDGAWHQNFMVHQIRAKNGGCRLVEGALNFTTTVNQLALG